MVAELGRFFGGKVLLLIRLKVFLHLLHDMLCLVKVLNIQVCRRPGNLLCMTALRTEFPLLETIHVREQTARGAPDDKVHTNEVIGVIVINKYRRFAEKTGKARTPIGGTGQIWQHAGRRLCHRMKLVRISLYPGLITSTVL